LEQSLGRLSTGLRINTGKDDPAGLIASENLRSDITSIKKAISNTDRANQVIATADSALGQVSGLLNDIRGLVTEAANTGGVSAEQIAANQSQIDSSLEALNRIAQTTTFQGRRLLDGSLDFITTAGTNFDNISDLRIDQANLGATGSVDVSVNVSSAATQAEVDVANIPAVSGTLVAATANLTVTNAAAQATGTVTVDSTNDATFTLTAVAGDVASGAEGNGVKNIVINDSAGGAFAYDASSNTLTLDVDITAGGLDTIQDLADAIDATGIFTTGAVTNGTDTITAANTGTGTLAGGRDAGSATIAVTADAAGSNHNNVTVTTTEVNTIANNTAVASIGNDGNISVKVHGTVTKAAIASAIDSLAGYHASVTASSGDTNYIEASDNVPGVATLLGGTGTSGITADVFLELSGATGTEVLSFGAGTSLDDLVKGVNLVQDATGVQARANGTTLELVSTAYGSKAKVDLKVISEGDIAGSPAGTFTTEIQAGSRSNGADIVASINGVNVKGDGNQFSINTATLDVSGSLAAGFTGTANFSITGGGALFQIGPDVVSNQQVRLGIASVNTARLGGVDGKLFQLGKGGSADLDTDPTVAASIVDEAINQVTSLRGRLGAFQRTSLQTNKEALNDTLVNLTDAESSIRDADFAAETAALTRAQILVQSGTTVLQVANQNPQNVLALLR